MGTSLGKRDLADVFLSVLIDTYNHERLIEQALSSVLEQDFPAAQREIIEQQDFSGIVDGASAGAAGKMVLCGAPRHTL